MPLLPKEIDVFPPDLFSLSSATWPWVVAHVRSRQEKGLARYLADNDLPFYLPTIAKETRRGGRTFKSFLPLFPGYVFVRAPGAKQELVWRSNLAASLIEVTDQARLGEELEQIHRLQQAGASFEVFDELVAGDPVRITEGAFSGYSGVVVRARGGDRLVVRISLLRQALAVEFGRDVLKRAK